MRCQRWLIGLFTIVFVGCSNPLQIGITPTVIPFPTATPLPSVIPFPTATPEPSVKPLSMATASPFVPTEVVLATATQVVPTEIALATQIVPTSELPTTPELPTIDQLPLAECQQAVQAKATDYILIEFSPELMRLTPITENSWELVSTVTSRFNNPGGNATFELLWSCKVSLDAAQQWSIDDVYYTSEW